MVPVLAALCNKPFSLSIWPARQDLSLPTWSTRELLKKSSTQSEPLSVDGMNRIAKLSALTISMDSAPHVHRAVSDIVKWTHEIAHLDTTGVEPMLTLVEDNAMPMRADVVSDGGDASAILRNAAHRDRSFFVVPKVVDATSES